MAKHDAGKPRRQFGAVPFIRAPLGQVQVLLLTSRETHRWVIPKGWPMPGRTGPEVAAQEAFEEAGVRGRIAGSGLPLGAYIYQKRISPIKWIACKVTVYRLKVIRELSSWPEREERERRWFDPGEAATLVAEPELADMLGMLAQSTAARPTNL